MKRPSRDDASSGLAALPVAVLLAVWLLANDSISPGHLLLGSGLAVLLTLAVHRLRPVVARPRRPWVILRLIGHVFFDIVRSNIAVGRVILGATRQQPTIGFVRIPLQLRDPHGLAMLSIIITGTPGTVWSGHEETSNTLILHVLDLQDEAAWIRIVQERYEHPLREIFE